MMRVAILLPRLDPGDAVGNDARGMLQVLMASGIQCKIFAGSWSKGERPEPVRKLKRFLGSGDLLIFHHTVHWPEGEAAFCQSPARKILKYHNLTPAHFFAPYSKAYADACALARTSLKALLESGVEKILCDSAFNLEDIVVEGANRSICEIVPPFHNIEQREKIDADLSIVYERMRGETDFLILSVGRIVPNKAYEHLIESFSVYQRAYGRGRLVLAGKQDALVATYTRKLHDLIASRGLRNSVSMLDHVSESRLRALFLIADCYAVTSEHEGFCVPVIEAMRMKIPVVGSGETAVPETLGGSGLYWDEFDPHVIASAFQYIANNKDTADSLGEVGFQSFQDRFLTARISEIFLKSIGRPTTSVVESGASSVSEAGR
ncbi:MAG: glycosyltransferase [Spirochaetia bacterium]|nr:glycosyltransferase [Spirochaetia bacterium]